MANPNKIRKREEVSALLNHWFDQTNVPDFIPNDPITIPHRYNKLQDIEIAGFFAAIMAWGNRTTIINKCTDLLERMDNSPYDFMINSSEKDNRRFQGFKHRTLNEDDVVYLVTFLRTYYQKHNSLESAFSAGLGAEDATVENGLVGFHNSVFGLPHVLERTRKHIATPARKSACKRLNMYLRWMVRSDARGVDFGLWKSISASQLICPLDVHVQRVALELQLIDRRQSDWIAAVALTETLKTFDANDPVKYDFALFGLGLSGFGQ